MSKTPRAISEACIGRAKRFDICFDDSNSPECAKFWEEEETRNTDPSRSGQCHLRSRSDFNVVLSSTSASFDRAALWRLAFKKTFPKSLYENKRQVDSDLVFFKHQKELLANNTSVHERERQEIDHAIDVVVGALNFAKAAMSHDDASARNAFATLQELVYEDGFVDKGENLILYGVAKRLEWDNPPASADALLSYLAHAKLEFAEKGLVEVKGFKEPTYLNKGLIESGSELRPGYEYIPPDDPRVLARDLGGTCYVFALSGYPNWKPILNYCHNDWSCLESLDGMLQYISSNFRTLDLKSEEAMVGDLVVYYGAANHPEHMAVVSAVDERGVPTRVFSKMGRELKFVDSPIDEVWLGLGFAWQVMRFVD